MGFAQPTRSAIRSPMANNMNFGLDEDIFAAQADQQAPKHEGSSLVVDKLMAERNFYED